MLEKLFSDDIVQLVFLSFIRFGIIGTVLLQNHFCKENAYENIFNKKVRCKFKVKVWIGNLFLTEVNDPHTQSLWRACKSLA